MLASSEPSGSSKRIFYQSDKKDWYRVAFIENTLIVDSLEKFDKANAKWVVSKLDNELIATPGKFPKWCDVKNKISYVVAHEQRNFHFNESDGNLISIPNDYKLLLTDELLTDKYSEFDPAIRHFILENQLIPNLHNAVKADIEKFNKLLKQSQLTIENYAAEVQALKVELANILKTEVDSINLSMLKRNVQECIVKNIDNNTWVKINFKQMHSDTFDTESFLWVRYLKPFKAYNPITKNFFMIEFVKDKNTFDWKNIEGNYVEMKGDRGMYAIAQNTELQQRIKSLNKNKLYKLFEEHVLSGKINQLDNQIVDNVIQLFKELSFENFNVKSIVDALYVLGQENIKRENILHYILTEVKDKLLKTANVELIKRLVPSTSSDCIKLVGLLETNTLSEKADASWPNILKSAFTYYWNKFIEEGAIPPKDVLNKLLKIIKSETPKDTKNGLQSLDYLNLAESKLDKISNAINLAYWHHVFITERFTIIFRNIMRFKIGDVNVSNYVNINSLQILTEIDKIYEKIRDKPWGNTKHSILNELHSLETFLYDNKYEEANKLCKNSTYLKNLAVNKKKKSKANALPVDLIHLNLVRRPELAKLFIHLKIVEEAIPKTPLYKSILGESEPEELYINFKKNYAADENMDYTLASILMNVALENKLHTKKCILQDVWPIYQRKKTNTVDKKSLSQNHIKAIDQAKVDNNIGLLCVLLNADNLEKLRQIEDLYNDLYDVLLERQKEALKVFSNLPKKLKHHALLFEQVAFDEIITGKYSSAEYYIAKVFNSTDEEYRKLINAYSFDVSNINDLVVELVELTDSNAKHLSKVDSKQLSIVNNLISTDTSTLSADPLLKHRYKLEEQRAYWPYISPVRLQIEEAIVKCSNDYVKPKLGQPYTAASSVSLSLQGFRGRRDAVFQRLSSDTVVTNEQHEQLPATAAKQKDLAETSFVSHPAVQISNEAEKATGKIVYLKRPKPTRTNKHTHFQPFKHPIQFPKNMRRTHISEAQYLQIHPKPDHEFTFIEDIAEKTWTVNVIKKINSNDDMNLGRFDEHKPVGSMEYTSEAKMLPSSCDRKNMVESCLASLKMGTFSEEQIKNLTLAFKQHEILNALNQNDMTKFQLSCDEVSINELAELFIGIIPGVDNASVNPDLKVIITNLARELITTYNKAQNSDKDEQYTLPHNDYIIFAYHQHFAFMNDERNKDIIPTIEASSDPQLVKAWSLIAELVGKPKDKVYFHNNSDFNLEYEPKAKEKMLSKIKITLELYKKELLNYSPSPSPYTILSVK